MIASAGASRNSDGCACGSIRPAPPSKTMNVGSLAGSVTPATLTAPVPSVSSAAACRSTASRALASAVAGEEALSSTTSLSVFLPSLSCTPPSALISSTASCAPRSIEDAIQGSVDIGALTTTGTVSPSEPQPATMMRRMRTRGVVRSIRPS